MMKRALPIILAVLAACVARAEAGSVVLTIPVQIDGLPPGYNAAWFTCALLNIPLASADDYWAHRPTAGKYVGGSNNFYHQSVPVVNGKVTVSELVMRMQVSDTDMPVVQSYYCQLSDITGGGPRLDPTWLGRDLSKPFHWDTAGNFSRQNGNLRVQMLQSSTRGFQSLPGVGH